MLLNVTDEWDPQVTITPDGTTLVLVDGEHSLRFRTFGAYTDWQERLDRFAAAASAERSRRMYPALFEAS